MTTIHVRYAGSRTDHTEIRRVFRDQNGPVGRDLDARSRRVLTRAQVLVGVRSGKLRATGRRGFGQGASGLYHDVTFGRPGVTPYLGAHHDGSRSHVIRPRRRRALRFVVGGRIVFAIKVRHPGSRGTRFLVRALDAAR